MIEIMLEVLVFLILAIFCVDMVFANEEARQTILSSISEAENIDDANIDNGEISTLATSGNATYNIYGETPFTEEYSVGAFVPASEVTGRECGSGFTHIGVSADGNGKYYIGTNYEKDEDVYVNVYGGFKMGTETYDYRIYLWLLEGDDFRYQVGTVSDSTDVDGTYGGFAIGQQSRVIFEDNYETKTEATVVVVEIHFYKGGTLATNNPEEVNVQGVGALTDIDLDGTVIEGYKLINGIDESTGIYLTSDTTVKVAEELTLEQQEFLKKYTTSTEGGWFGTIATDGISPEFSYTSQALYYEFKSSADSPLTFYYYCYSGFRFINSIFSKHSNISYRRRIARRSK